MSETAKSQDDLSIEEILGSIRRIIAEDEDEQPAQPQQAAAERDAAAAIAPEADISFDEEDEEPLELTHKIEPQEADVDALVLNDHVDNDIDIVMDAAVTNDDLDNVFADAEIQPQPVAADEFVIEDTVIEENFAEQVIEPVAVAPTASVQEEKPVMTTSQDDAALKDNALLSSNAAIATAAVMAKLARQAAITEEGNSNLTLEAMVKEMIRPMLREWLDANLPDLVQKMVERELERLTKRL